MDLPILTILTVGLLPSSLKRLYYVLRGAKIAKGVRLGVGSVLLSDSIEIDSDTSIGPFSVVAARKVVIGKRVKIGAMCFLHAGQILIGNDARLYEQVRCGGLETPRSTLSIGNRVSILQFTYINATERVTIEDDVGIGGACFIFTHGVWQSALDGFPVQYAPVTIGRGAWLPWHVFVLPGVKIGEFATVGACSLVSRDIPPRSLALGMPAKVVRGPGEYAMRLNESERDSKMREILQDFVEYMRYNHHNVATQTVAETTRVLVEWNKGRWRKLVSRAAKTLEVIYVRVASSDSDQFQTTGDRMSISLSEIPTAIRQEYAGSGIEWIDVALSERSQNGSVIAEELVSYLSRFGIHLIIRETDSS